MSVNGFPTAYRAGGFQSPAPSPASPGRGLPSWWGPGTPGYQPRRDRFPANTPRQPPARGYRLPGGRYTVAGVAVSAAVAAYYAATRQQYEAEPEPETNLPATVGSPADYVHARSWDPDIPNPWWGTPQWMGVEAQYLRASHNEATTNAVMAQADNVANVQGYTGSYGVPPWAHNQNGPLVDPPDNARLMRVKYARANRYGTWLYASVWTEYWTASPGAPAVAPRAVPATIPVHIPDSPALPALAPPAPWFTPGHVPWRQLPAWRRFTREVSPDPYAQPRSRPRRSPRADPYPAVQVTVGPRSAPRIDAGPPHRYEPPGRGERERKAKTRYAAAWDELAEVFGVDIKRPFNNLTEALDWLNAVFYALPEERWRGARTPQEKAWAIATHLDELDPDQLVKNIVFMEVQDRVIGRVSGQAFARFVRAGFDTPNLFGGFV
jgi:hypothetical protein